MKLRNFAVFLVIFLVAAAAHAAGRKTDVYFGYSRVGANLYAANTPAMNGWQGAVHVKFLPFVGVEGDVSHYSQTSNGYHQNVTLVMFGPRVTVHAVGFGLFAHVLGGLAHQSGSLGITDEGYNAGSYAAGGGADIPLLLGGLKLRVTGDYLGNSSAPSSTGVVVGSVSHYRFGGGLAYHF